MNVAWIYNPPFHLYNLVFSPFTHLMFLFIKIIYEQFCVERNGGSGVCHKYCRRNFLFICLPVFLQQKSLTKCVLNLFYFFRIFEKKKKKLGFALENCYLYTAIVNWLQRPSCQLIKDLSWCNPHVLHQLRDEIRTFLCRRNRTAYKLKKLKKRLKFYRLKCQTSNFLELVKFFGSESLC